MNKVVINAVRKVLYYTQNYQSVQMKHNITGETICMPDVIVNAKWGCNASHIADKYRYNYGYDLIRLFLELDTDNQIAFIDYILENYKGVEDIC